MDADLISLICTTQLREEDCLQSWLRKMKRVNIQRALEMLFCSQVLILFKFWNNIHNLFSARAENNG